MKKIVYGSLSVLTAVLTVFAAAKAEVFNGDRAPEATSEVAENGKTARLPQTPDSLTNGFDSGFNSPLDGNQSLRLSPNATKANVAALSSASLPEKRLPTSTATSSILSASAKGTPSALTGSSSSSQVVRSTMVDSTGSNAIGSGSIGSNGLVGSAVSDRPAISYGPIAQSTPTQSIPTTVPAVPTIPTEDSALPGPGTSPSLSPDSILENGDLENGSLERENSVEIGQPVTEGDDPFAVPDSTGTESMDVTPEPAGMGTADEDEDLGTEGAGADDLVEPANGTIVPSAPGTGLESETDIEPDMEMGPDTEIDSGTEMAPEMEPDTDLEDADSEDADSEEPDAASDAGDEKFPPSTPSGTSDFGAPSSPSPGLGSPATPLPGATPGGISPNVTPTTPISPGGTPAPVTPITPLPESPSGAPINPVTPLEPMEEDVVPEEMPEEMPTSGTESPGSSDRLIGEGFSPFQLSYLAIGGGLEGIPGGDQLLSAYESGDLSAADIVDAGAASNRLGADANDQDDYTAGVDRFLALLSRDD